MHLRYRYGPSIKGTDLIRTSDSEQGLQRIFTKMYERASK